MPDAEAATMYTWTADTLAAVKEVPALVLSHTPVVVPTSTTPPSLDSATDVNAWFTGEL